MSRPLQGVQGIVGKFSSSILALAGPLAAAFSFGKVISETKEAQAALAQLNVAFENSAESARRSKEDILAFSDAAQRSSTFSDESITRSQTALLRFSRVSGEVFDRARKDILDVSAALGTDLETAAFSVGRALQSPTQGLRQLRALGVIFTESQQKLIKSLEETGQVAKAQDIILQALESRFSGAAAAARNTLGGAIEGLKNAFGDLFEATDQGASKAAEGINEISSVISDPQFKASIQSFIGESLSWLAAFTNLISKSIQGWQLLLNFVVKETPSALDKLYEKQSELGASLNRALDEKAKTLSRVEQANAQKIIDAARAELADIQRQIASFRQGQGGPQGVGSRQVSKPGGTQFVSEASLQQARDDAAAAARAHIDEVRITAQKKNIEGLNKLLQEFDEQTRTTLESANSQFEMTQLKLLELYQAGVIGVEQLADRLSAATIQFNESIDIEPVRISVQKVAEGLNSQQRAVQGFVDTVKTGLANLAQAGQLTGRSIVRYLLSALQSKVLMKAIEALGAALQKSLTKGAAGGKGGGWQSFISGVIGAFSAGGGRTSGPRIVGEEGPELLVSSGNVMNRRQLAFAMGNGGGGVSIGDTTIVVQGASDPIATAQLVEARIQTNNRRQLEHINRLLNNNGFGNLR